MKLLLPVFGVLAAAGSCCCLGSDGVLSAPAEIVPESPPTLAVPPPLPPLPGAPVGTAPLAIPAVGEPAAGSSPSGATSPGAESPAPPATTAAATGIHEGTLLSGDSRSVRLRTTGGQAPPVGASATLSKWVQKQIFGANVTMWLGVANGKVTAVDATTVTIAVEEVTFDATVNGKKVDPFEVGVKTQVEWTEK